MSQQGDGDFTTISAAVSKVQAGTRILVRPGVYQELVAVTKHLEIIGDGPKEQIVVENKYDDCIVLDTSSATIRGLTFRGGNNYGLKDNRTGEGTRVVAIKQGQPLIEDCDILSSAGTGVVLLPDPSATTSTGHSITLTAPTMRRCRIIGGGSAIHCDGGETPPTPTTIEDCEISEQPYGVQMPNVVMRRCRLRGIGDQSKRFTGHPFYTKDCQYHGLNHYSGLVEDCDISGYHTGINTITGTGTIRRCRVYDNYETGILALGPNRIIENCVVEGNSDAGIVLAVSNGTTIHIRGCQIRKNRHAISLFSELGQVILEDCDLTGNREGSGLAVALLTKNVQRRGVREDSLLKTLFGRN